MARKCGLVTSCDLFALKTFAGVFPSRTVPAVPVRSLRVFLTLQLMDSSLAVLSLAPSIGVTVA
jgi:hypothetical protein